jgi:hypothetical protein
MEELENGEKAWEPQREEGETGSSPLSPGRRTGGEKAQEDVVHAEFRPRYCLGGQIYAPIYRYIPTYSRGHAHNLNLRHFIAPYPHHPVSRGILLFASLALERGKEAFLPPR